MINQENYIAEMAALLRGAADALEAIDIDRAPPIVAFEADFVMRKLVHAVEGL